MTGRTIHVETELPTRAERVWAAMKHPASFLYVTRGLVGFPALAGRTDPIRPGEAGTGWVLAFNLIPAYRHTIEVLDVDEHTCRRHFGCPDPIHPSGRNGNQSRPACDSNRRAPTWRGSYPWMSKGREPASTTS